MDKIKTAEELVRKYLTLGEVEFLGQSSINDLVEAMKEFAKYHVEQSLLKAAEDVSLTDFAEEFLQEAAFGAINKDSILNSYPLSNIK